MLLDYRCRRRSVVVVSQDFSGDALSLPEKKLTTFSALKTQAKITK